MKVWVLGAIAGLVLALALILSFQAKAGAQELRVDACIIDPLCVVVEVPVVEVVEKIVEVPVEVVREVPVEVPVPGPTVTEEVRVPVPGPTVTEYVEVPSETITERVEVPVEVPVPGPTETVTENPPEEPEPEQQTPAEERTVVRRVVEEVTSWPWWVYIVAAIAGAGVTGGFIWHRRLRKERDERAQDDLEVLKDIRSPHS